MMKQAEKFSIRFMFFGNILTDFRRNMIAFKISFVVLHRHAENICAYVRIMLL